MVQVIEDNFDTDISSPNGKLSTHSLAMILTQPVQDKLVVNDYIARLSHTDAMLPIEDYSIHCNQKVKYNVVYLPMINRPPAEYATIKAMVATERPGQPFVVFTADQLAALQNCCSYHVENHTLFNNFHL